MNEINCLLFFTEITGSMFIFVTSYSATLLGFLMNTIEEI